MFAEAVLQRAAVLHQQEMTAFAEAVGTHVGNAVADIVRAMSPRA